VLETKLIVDSCIHLPSQWFKLNVVPGAFLDQPDKPMSLKISKSLTTAPDVKVRARHMVLGRSTRRPRSTAISNGSAGGAAPLARCPSQGCSYRSNERLLGGGLPQERIEYVAHIGKNKDNKAHTDAVIAGWNNYARLHQDSIIGGSTLCATGR